MRFWEALGCSLKLSVVLCDSLEDSGRLSGVIWQALGSSGMRSEMLCGSLEALGCSLWPSVAFCEVLEGSRSKVAAPNGLPHF